MQNNTTIKKDYSLSSSEINKSSTIPWHPNSWQEKEAKQLPCYPNEPELQEVLKRIGRLPPLVFGGEAISLRKKLALTAKGQGFLLQGGDCSERFQDQTANYLRDTFKILLQMAIVLTFAGGVPVVKVGRIAGQYAKPRSSDYEEINGKKVLSYKGDNINGIHTDDRTPDPNRMIEGYNVAAASINLLRAFAEGGLSDLALVHRWMLDFVKDSPETEKFEDIASRIDDTMKFMHACGVNSEISNNLKRTDFFTSHEALLLPFEESMTRRDSISNAWFDCSAHMLWIGDRTRDPNGAHVEFCRGIKNPIGIKCGPSLSSSDLLSLLDILDPDHSPGRIVLIIRMGYDKIAAHLPNLIRAVQDNGRAEEVVWACDPMHGNTTKTPNNYKTRHLDNIRSEIQQFFNINADMKNYAGGIHLELTGQNVTECSGGAQNITHNDLADRYLTACDPRLNAQQSLEIAFSVAEYIRQQEQRKKDSETIDSVSSKK